jgi:hypothetical protein
MFRLIEGSANVVIVGIEGSLGGTGGSGGRGFGFRLQFRLCLYMSESLSRTLLIRLVDHILVRIQILGSEEKSSS